MPTQITKTEAPSAPKPPTPRKKADEYLAHFVGHEGAGSLLSALKARSWATELSAGVSDQSSVCWLFEVSITLTEAGLAAGPGEAGSSVLSKVLITLTEAGLGVGLGVIRCHPPHKHTSTTSPHKMLLASCLFHPSLPHPPTHPPHTRRLRPGRRGPGV